jgi:membrane protein YqaA with SNARE-associated domain
MQSFFSSIFSLFLSPFGLLALAALDSSMLFFLPLAVDAAVVILSARHQDMFWIFPILAAIGSVIGASVTFWIGRKIGEKGLEHWVAKARLDRVQRKIKDKGAIAIAIPALLPPPFPLTPFILACGALSVRTKPFVLTLGLVRMVRFGILSVLGWAYGPRVLEIFESTVFKGVITFLIVVAIAGTAYGVYRLIVTTRSHGRQASAATSANDGPQTISSKSSSN